MRPVQSEDWREERKEPPLLLLVTSFEPLNLTFLICGMGLIPVSQQHGGAPH